jgi:hypothetical protein
VAAMKYLRPGNLKITEVYFSHLWDLRSLRLRYHISSGDSLLIVSSYGRRWKGKVAKPSKRPLLLWL